MAIDHCGSIADCVRCTSTVATAAVVDSVAGHLSAAAGNPTVIACQRALSAGSDKYLRAASSALERCWAQVAAGNMSAPCPGLADGSVAGKLAKVAAKIAKKVCKRCGGADRGCDADTAGVAGTGGVDDLTAAAIGTAATCPDLIPPSTGLSCVGAVDNLSDLFECTHCVARFATECSAALAIPASAEYPATCPGVADEECPGCVRWSDSNTWPGGVKPTAGDDVVIPAEWHLLLDEDTPALGGLTIHGTLEFDRQNLAVTADWIMVHGTLRVGSPAQPFTHQAVFTLTDGDANGSVMGMGTRGIMVMGGALELHGAPPPVPWTKISAHAPAGASSLQLVESVDWNPGDEIVVAPTNYYSAFAGASVTQRLILSAVAGDELTMSSTLNAARWGVLQYATPNGMSLSPDDRVISPVADTETEKTPTILDQRAEVGNLTRNILIQAPDDMAWQAQGFGVHVMIMSAGGTAHVDGVAFRRAGQRGLLGRYPFHWHMLSYSGTETLGDATGQYIRNSAVHGSMNRGIVVHGTNGVLVQDNVVYDVRGHGIFLEDSVERRNTITGNLVLHVRNPDPQYALKLHEIGPTNVGSSAYWITNPDNVLTGNTAADSEGFGFWLAFPARPWGAAANVLLNGTLMRPNRLRFGVFDRNTAHSNRREGLMLDFVQINEEGATAPLQYWSTSNGAESTWPFTNLERFTLSRFTVWKSGIGGLWDRGVWPNNFEIVSADNCMRFFAGSGADGLITRSLIVGTSLNTYQGEQRPGWGGDPTPSAFATYHSAFDITNNIVLNFPLVPGVRSGAFATDDYYIRPLEKGQIRNAGNLLINSHPGFRLSAPFPYFVLAGALWDPHGIWGPGGDNSYLVYDTPFLTAGQTPTVVAPGAEAGAVVVDGPFYGFNDFVVNNGNLPYQDLMAIHVTRLDQDLVEVGDWSVDQAGSFSWLLSHMRHFAAHADGIFRLDFPTFGPDAVPAAPAVVDMSMSFDGMLEEDDTLVIGVEFDGTVVPNAVYVQAIVHYEVYTQVESLEAVRTSAGETWWQDAANNLVWVKLRGGRWQWWTTDPELPPPTPDDLLYEPMTLHINTDIF